MRIIECINKLRGYWGRPALVDDNRVPACDLGRHGPPAAIVLVYTGTFYGDGREDTEVHLFEDIDDALEFEGLTLGDGVETQVIENEPGDGWHWHAKGDRKGVFTTR